MALGTYQNWRDIADLAMAAKDASDPDHMTYSGSGKWCLSRVIYLVNIRSNQVVGKRIVKLIYRESDFAIITTYPSSHQC